MNNERSGEWGIRLAALALAVLIWLHAITENEYHREYEIPIRLGEVISQSDEGPLVVANSVPDRCRVLLAGRGKDLFQIDEEAFFFKISPIGLPRTSKTRRLLLSDVEGRAANSKIQIQQIIDPREIDIELDILAERQVQVDPVVGVRIAEGHTLVGEASVEPRTVTASGPSLQIETLGTIKTVPVTMENATQDISRQLSLEQPTNTRIKLDPSEVTYSADVQIIAENVMVDVPVRIANRDTTEVIAVPSRVRVKVRGGIDIIAALDPQKDLELSVDYSVYHGSELPIYASPSRFFEIREISPSTVQLIER